jgi:hypothetical protein
MADLTDSLNELLGARTAQISRRIDADESQTAAALQAAIPTLMAALSGEASRGEAAGLRAAIERDHDGSILDQLDDYLGGNASGLSPRTTNGAGILSHVLGDQQEDVARALSAKSGLDLGSIMQLLPLLAPILMGMLGKRGGSGGSGGFSLDDLGGLLGGETESAKRSNPDIGDILDQLGGGRSNGSASGSSSSGSRSGSRSASGGLGGILDAILGRRKR